LAFINTDIRHYIEPYIHLNISELTQNLNTAVLGGFLSKQTAAEKLPYSTPQEWERILQEKHDEQMHQLLLEEQKLEIQNDANIEMQEELAGIQTEQQVDVMKAQNQIENEEEGKGKKTSKKKYSVATGRGAGRPNKSGRMYDENGNWEGRNNWGNWNDTH
jgi:hypothetical protein